MRIRLLTPEAIVNGIGLKDYLELIMSVFQRQIIKGSISNFAGIGLGVLNNIWLFPLAFSLEQLGIYRWVERTAALVGAIALLGIQRTYVRYQSQFKEEQGRIFLSNIVVIGALLAAVLGVLLTLFATEFSALLEVEGTEEIVVLGTVITGIMCFSLGQSISASAKRISVPYFMKNVGVRLVLMVAAYLVSLEYVTFFQWMKVFALFQLILGIGILAYSIRIKGLPLTRPRSLNKGMSKEFYVYSAGSIGIVIMSTSLITIDSQMITFLLSYEALGVYSLGFFIGSFVDGFRRPVSQALSPEFANLWNDGNKEAIEKIYARTSRVLMVVAVASFIAIVPNLDFIFGLIPDPERFEGAKSIVVLVLISRIIDFSFGSNGEMLSNGPYFKWLLYAITGLVLLMIVLNYQLIPMYGMDGAGYALIISFIVFNVAKAWFLYRKEGIQPFSLVHLYILAIALPTFFIAELFDGPGILEFIFRNASIALGLVVGFVLLRKRI